MSAPGDEFSFHEMEKIKEQLRPGLGSEPTGATPAETPLAAVADAIPQEVFSRSVASSMESLQLKRVIRSVRRHWPVVLIITVCLPTMVYLHDDVLNRPNMPAWLQRFGARRNYATAAEVLLQELPSAGESGVVPVSRYSEFNISQVLDRNKFRKTFHTLLSAKLENSGAAPEDKKLRGLLQQYLQRGGDENLAVLSASPMEDNQFTIRVAGSAKMLLPYLCNNAVQALNTYYRKQRDSYLGRALDQYTKRKGENGKALQKAWLDLSKLNRELAHEDPAQLRALATRERFEEEYHKTRMAYERAKIRLAVFKRKANYEKIAKRFFIQSDNDIAKVMIEGNPLRQEWARLEAELERARTRYTPAHPKILLISADINAVEKRLRESDGMTAKKKLPGIPNLREINILRQVSELNNQVVLSQSEIVVLEERIQEAKALEKKWSEQGKAGNDERLQKRNEIRAEVNYLQAKAITAANRIAELEMLRTAIGQEDRFELVATAGVGRQISPNVRIDVPVAFIIGLLLGGGLVLLRENMDVTFHTPSDIYYHLRLNYLGVVPFYSEKERKVIDPNRPNSELAEVCAHLCNNIRYAKGINPEKCLLIASATQGEGKSTISANLSIRYALEGNTVLLVDADMRRPRGHKLLDEFHSAGDVSVGLSDYLEGQGSLEEMVKETAIPGFSFLSAGKRVINPAKLLGSKRMLTLLEEVKRNYDIVVFDCPATLPVVDATILAPHMRGVLLVVAAEEVEIGAARTAMYRLKHVGAPVVGAVLNKVRERSTSYSYYGYRYRRGYYYTPYGLSGESEDGKAGSQS